MKAFIRKGISNNWKSNTGAAMLEKISLTNRQKQWLLQIAECFGCWDVIGVDILVDKEGHEIIHDVNDVITLLGDTQEDDRRAIADIVQNHIIQRQSSLSSYPQYHRPGMHAPPPPPRPQSSTIPRSSTFEKHSNEQQRVNGENLSSRRSSAEPGVSSMKPQRSTSKSSESSNKETPATYPDDTMGQLKRTFAGIFGEVQ